MRVAINLLTEDPERPSGAHWFWTRVIPEMAARLEDGEELHLLVSPKSRHLHANYGPGTYQIAYPWSNERRSLRTLSEHLYSPVRLPLGRIDVLNTLMAPIFNPTWGLVIHMKTMHAFTVPQTLSPPARVYRRLNYPRSARLANSIIVNSKSMRDEVLRYIDVDPAKLTLIYEAVDHETFRPGDARSARQHLEKYGIDRPFTLFVSSLWRYKNCDGLLRAWAATYPAPRQNQLVIVGHGRDKTYADELRALAVDLGIGDDVVFVGGVPLEETPMFYRAADVLVYPSFDETFGLPILEAMACGCPVVTSNVSAMPEIAGGAAVLCDPNDPGSIGKAIRDVADSGPERLRSLGLKRAGEFRWGRTAEETLHVYRDVAARRRFGRR
jgi:glycosyltransferase involved in cell wall biosynthesis